MELSVIVEADQKIGYINPNIYGHFIEHLGRCIYSGIWVGEDSKIPNIQGLRKDIVDGLKRINAPVIRWPGGCFADTYHWRDGVGPKNKRPHSTNLFWGGVESNEFGTDEFMRFCESIGAEPYISVNLGSGSPEEALSWLEYCNQNNNSNYANLRIKNGHIQPYKVKYWGIGNENYGCGGNFDPVFYAQEYRRFATYFKTPIYLKCVEPSIQLVACGHTSRDWSLRFMEAMKERIFLVDHLSVHYYFAGSAKESIGGDVNFADNEYINLLFDVQNLEFQIQQAVNIVDFFSEGKKNIGIVVDEWGVGSPTATWESGLYQQNTLRDAILAAVVLNLFNRYSSKIVMANIAQTVNVLQSLFLTKGQETIMTPTYHVFSMFKDHMSNYSVKIETDSPVIKEAKKERNARAQARQLKPLKAIDASASISKDGKRMVLTLVNQSLDEDIETEIRLCRRGEFDSGSLSVLTSADVRDYNSFNIPSKVTPTETSLDVKKHALNYTIQRHSVNKLLLTLK